MKRPSCEEERNANRYCGRGEVGAASSTIITAAGARSQDREASYEAPDSPGLGETELPSFNEMRDVGSHISPFHTETVVL